MKISIEKSAADALKALLFDLEVIGFCDPDGDVNGGDCVEVINQHLDALRAALCSPGSAMEEGEIPPSQIPLLEWKASGEANEYRLMKDGNWLANFRMNGELLVSQQEEYAAMFAASPKLHAALKSTVFGTATEIFPGATREEVISVMMQDIVGDYDVPEEVPEWAWIESAASFNHVRNGQDGVWEFVLNLSKTFSNIPDRLKPVLDQARQDNLSYLIFHQGT